MAFAGVAEWRTANKLPCVGALVRCLCPANAALDGRMRGAKHVFTLRVACAAPSDVESASSHHSSFASDAGSGIQWMGS